jgi:LmbE family N-acetylglucosaminyl deacetylase
LSPIDFTGMNVVCVGTHPDDPELLCYGTLLYAAEQGAQVTVVIVSDGANGVSIADAAAGVRLDEAQRMTESTAAFAGTGIEVVCLGRTDGALVPDHALISAIESVLVERGCHVLITHHPAPGNDHQDHPAVGQAALNAAGRVGTVRMVLHGRPHAPGSSIRANLAVDITEFLDAKVRALAAHQTQSGRWYLSEAFTRDRAAQAGWHLAPALTAAGRRFEEFECSLLVVGSGQR